MKSYNHLYEKFVSHENYVLAVQNATACKGGKKCRNETLKYIKKHMDELEPNIVQYAIHFRTMKHTPKQIYDGIRKKKRTIIVPTPFELIVHHMIVNVMQPIIMRPMYVHSYGSLPGRGLAKGQHKKQTRGGKNAIEKFIRTHPDDCKFCLKIDIHKFFDSVPHDKLKAMLAQTIHDIRYLEILYEVIDGPGGTKGIPIGFYTSQWFANYYLTGLDHYIKEQLKAKGYYRYMDDIIIFGPDKYELHEIRKAIDRYLNEVLGLRMNPKWQVFLFHSENGEGRFADFMGFRFLRGRTVLRKSILLKATRKARRIAAKRKPTLHDYRQLLSYKGWFAATNTKGLYNQWIRPHISFQTAQKAISAADKRKAKEAA